MMFFMNFTRFIFPLRTESHGRFYLEAGSTRACMRWRRDACGGDSFSPSSWEPQEEGIINIAARFSLS
jgi:hypothetical protein